MREIKNQPEVQQIIWISEEPSNFTGHVVGVFKDKNPFKA
jgi:hypothetical protein